jgi:uncharacterized damage-inducible protein DinB
MLKRGRGRRHLRPHRIGEALLHEFDDEMANTRKMLERAPENKFDWKPHEKSSTLGKLASHLATLPLFAAVVIHGHAKQPAAALTKSDVLESFDKNAAAGREAIANTNDDHLNAMMGGAAAGFLMPRVALLRQRVMSHLIHHRGQLSVYLRLLDVSVPGMYGLRPTRNRRP